MSNSALVWISLKVDLETRTWGQRAGLGADPRKQK